MRFENEKGQSIILVALAMSIFLLGAVGLGFDGSNLYSQRQLAQNAADSAAIAGIMSVYDATTGKSGTGFATSGTLTCSSTDTRTPCAYAIKNGFGTAADTVTIDFPGSISGVNLSSNSIYPVTTVRANVSRNVNTTLMRLLGPTVTTVKATATAAIVSVTSPIPIIVVHPTLSQSFSVQGNPVVQICGGPQRSIQVDSSSSTAFNIGGNAAVDLSKGGPADTKGDCTTPGNGTDLGNWGGPTPSGVTTVNGSSGCAKGNVCIGTKGHYLDPASWVKDPLETVSAPSVPGTVVATPLTVAAGKYGCPVGTSGGCALWTPGSYTTNIDGKGQYNLFAPGIYYINETTDKTAFGCSAICTMAMATGLTDNKTTLSYTLSGVNATVTNCCGTNTSWDGTTTNGGMLVYNAGAGAFVVGANGSASLIGTTGSSAYKGMLFFENRAAGADSSSVKNPTLNKFTPHQLGGGGALSLIGTIYLTNTRTTMLGAPNQYQELDLSGNSGNSTYIQGEIIVDSLQMGGGGTIKMNLNATTLLMVDEVALVN